MLNIKQEEGVFTQVPKSSMWVDFTPIALCVENNFYCFYVPINTFVIIYKYDENI